MVRNDTGELVGQFLLISPDNRTVAPDLVDHYEHVVTIFAEETIKTEVYQRITREFRALGVNDVLNLFFDSIKKARKKKPIAMDKSLFSTAISKVATKSINDYEYSATLVKIAEYKGKIYDLRPRIKNDKNTLLTELSKDMLEFLTSEYPHALVMFPKIDSLRKNFLKHITSELDNIQSQNKVQEALQEIIQDFKQKDMKKILADFALNDLNKANLYARLEDEIFVKFKREFPLLFLVDPEINGFKSAVEKLTAEINEEYDVAGTLSRIGQEMLKNNKKDEELVIPYIRHFCDQFSTGLTLTAWKYMQVLFKLITLEVKIDVRQVLPGLKGSIPDSHFLTLQKMITKYKLTKLDPLSFSVKKATDILPFYRALLSGIGFGVNRLISEIILGEKNPNNYLKHTAKNLDKFCIQTHNVFAVFEIYHYLENLRKDLGFNLVYPDINAFGKQPDVTTLDPQTLIQALIDTNATYTKKEHELLKRRISDFQKAFDNRIKDIERFLSRNPINISKGYSMDFKEVKILSFSTEPVNEIDRILKKGQNEYKKILEKTLSELDKAKDAAVEFVGGKMEESKYKSIIENRIFLSKTQQDFQKLLQRFSDAVTKTYNDLPFTIEKKFNGFQKDFSKKYNQACPFLNINRKALSKGEVFLTDLSSKIDKIQSSINQIVGKEEILTWDAMGEYYFRAITRSLPSHIETEITNALVHKKNYPYLKEALDIMKKNPNYTIYRTYIEVLENHAKNVIGLIFNEVGRVIDKDSLVRDQEVFFIERDRKPIPTMEMGVLENVDAMNSLRNILGSYIAVESEEREDKTLFHVSALVPSFGADFRTLKKVWKKRDWTLRRVLLLLSWHSLLEANSFYVNLIRFSAGMYSTRVKESIEEIFEHIERNITVS